MSTRLKVLQGTRSSAAPRLCDSCHSGVVRRERQTATNTSTARLSSGKSARASSSAAAIRIGTVRLCGTCSRSHGSCGRIRSDRRSDLFARRNGPASMRTRNYSPRIWANQPEAGEIRPLPSSRDATPRLSAASSRDPLPPIRRRRCCPSGRSTRRAGQRICLA
jgi:hypothetical protein